MKMFVFECKKLLRTSGFNRLCVTLFVLCIVLALTGTVREPSASEKQAYLEAYDAEITYVIRLAENNKLDYTYTAGQNSYIVRYQEDLIQHYTALQEEGIIPYIVTGWDAFFSLSVDDFLLLLCAVLTGITLTMIEKDHRTDMVLAVVPHGIAAWRAKLLVFMLASMAFSVLFACCGMTGIALRYGLSSPFVPLCSVQEFLFCPYGISIFVYLLISVTVKAIVAFVVMAFCGTIASLCKSYLLSFFVTACALTGGWIWGKTEDIFALVNPVDVLGTDVFLERYRSVPVFGFSVPLEAVVATVFLCLSIGSAILFFVMGKKGTSSHRVIEFEQSVLKAISRVLENLRNCFPKPISKRHSIFVTELNKQLVKSHLLVLCVAMLLLKGAYAYSTAPFRDPTEHIYLTVCNELSGELTEEKRTLISENLLKSEKVIRDFEEIRTQFQSGKISHEIYHAKRMEYESALADQYVYTKLSLQSNRIDLAASRGQKAYLQYDTGWLSLFASEGDFLLYSFLLLFFFGSYTIEYTSGFHRTAFVTVRGIRDIHRAKHLVAILVGTIAVFLFFIIDILLLHQAFPLSDSFFSAGGILQIDIPLWGALVLFLLIRLLLGIGYALLVNSLSRLLKKPYLVLPVGLLLAVFFL